MAFISSDKAEEVRYHEYMNGKQKIFLIAGAIVLGFIGWWFMRTPSTERDWSLDQAVLPAATIKGNLVTLENIRNFSYTSPTSYTPAYYDKTFNLDELERVWYVVEPFSGYKGAAHTFLSFEFTGDNFLAVSVEIRKENIFPRSRVFSGNTNLCMSLAMNGTLSNSGQIIARTVYTCIPCAPRRKTRELCFLI